NSQQAQRQYHNKIQDEKSTNCVYKRERTERNCPLSRHNRCRQGLLSRRKRVRSKRPLRGRRTPLTGGSPPEEVSSNHDPHPKYRETDYCPSEWYRRGKRGKLGPCLRYPSGFRGGGPQTSLHRNGPGTRFWK